MSITERVIEVFKKYGWKTDTDTVCLLISAWSHPEGHEGILKWFEENTDLKLFGGRKPTAALDLIMSKSPPWRPRVIGIYALKDFLEDPYLAWEMDHPDKITWEEFLELLGEKK